MPRFCIYCGKQIKENDRFCIYCGKPLLSDLPKTSKKPKEKVLDKFKEITPKLDKKQKKELEKEEEDKILEDIKEVGGEEGEVEKEVEETKKEKKKEKKEKEKKEKIEVKPLPEDVKQQIEFFLELTDVRLKKKSLADKLTDFQKLINNEKYDTDFEFSEKINIQLKAVKTLIEEVKKKENEIKQKMDSPFIVERLNRGIATKRSQLKNLTREHRLKKVKDKDIFNKLKERYKKELKDLETEREELVAGMKLWIEEMKMEELEVSTEQKLNKGQFSAKEISEKEFKEKDDVFERRLNKISSMLKTLENLTKKKIKD